MTESKSKGQRDTGICPFAPRRQKYGERIHPVKRHKKDLSKRSLRIAGGGSDGVRRGDPCVSGRECSRKEYVNEHSVRCFKGGCRRDTDEWRTCPYCGFKRCDPSGNRHGPSAFYACAFLYGTGEYCPGKRGQV